MKKILLTIISILSLPILASASYAVGWQATSTTAGQIFPNPLNGVYQAVVAPYFVATSTATSTFKGSIISPCFATSTISGCITSGGGGSGTVTSVGLTTPTGLSVSGSPVTTSGTFGLTYSAGYNLPLTASTTNWTTAYNNYVSSWTTPLQFSAGTASILQAGTSQSGYLSSTDWNTFNNKTSNTGTVTSVGGTGTVNGLTLTGTVTSSGNLTLGGTLAINNANWSGTDLSVANGGTGASTLTGIIKGNGTSAFTVATAGTDYQVPITLTTSGSSGASTFDGTTLNIPQYTGNTGTVTSVGVGSTGSTISITGSPITTSGTINAELNLTHANTWTARQTFASTTFTGLTNKVLATDGSGNLVATTTNTGTVTSITASSPLTGGTITTTGSIGCQTASGPGSVAATLSTVNSNVGSFGGSTAIPNFTVNGKGLITAAGTNAVVAPAGTLTGATLASNVLTSSLTSVGTIGNLSFTNASGTIATTSKLIISGITGTTTCLQADTNGVVSGTGVPCGSGGGGAVNSVTNSDGTLTISPTTGSVVASRAAITGDVSISSGSNSSVLATVNSNVGSFNWANVTTNGKGLITAVSSNATPVTSIGGLTGAVATSSLGLVSYGYGSSTYYLATNPSSYVADSHFSGTSPVIYSAGTISCPTCLTANQTITLSGDVSGSGATSITTAIGAGKVTNAMLAGSIASSKLVGTDIATVGTITSGVWNGTAIANANLANSTISGISLGSNLASLTHDTTLTGTSYNGSASVSNWGLDLTHANTWTGGQIFTNATSTTFATTFSTTSQATTTNQWFTGLANTLLAVDGSGKVIATTTIPYTYRSFTLATTTAWTGTTTPRYLAIGAGETVTALRCATDAGTTTVDINVAGSHNYFTASSTPGVYSTSIALTSGATTTVSAGNPSGSPTQVVCTLKTNLSSVSW